MRLLSTISVVVAFAAMCAAPANAQENRPASQSVESGLRGLVRVRVRSISSDETRYAGRGIPAWYEFAPGDSTSFLVTAGRVDRDRSDVCLSGAVAGPLPLIAPSLQPNVTRQEATAMYAWHVDLRMVEVNANTITFDVSWQRTSHAAPDDKMQFSQRLVLRPDESRVIDLVRQAPVHMSPSSGDVDCVGVMVLVEAGITEEPSLQGKTIDWDLWASVGPTTAPHQRLRSVQGDGVDFSFDPIAVSGSVDDRREWLSGTVTGRVRLDGNIDVSLDVRAGYMQRILSQAEVIAMFKNQRLRGTPSGFVKNFVAKPGEAVKIVMPAKIQPATTGPVTGKPVIQPLQPGYEMSITVQARVH
jgi:hypothetical protein